MNATAQFLADAFGDLDKIANADEEELQRAEEVGPKVSQSIRRFFHEKNNRELIERLREERLPFKYQDKKKAGGPLAGMTFVLTERFGPVARGSGRELIAVRRESIGFGKQEDPVTPVAGADPGSKLDKADDSGAKARDRNAVSGRAGGKWSG